MQRDTPSLQYTPVAAKRGNLPYLCVVLRSINEAKKTLKKNWGRRKAKILTPYSRGTQGGKPRAYALTWAGTGREEHAMTLKATCES